MPTTAANDQAEEDTAVDTVLVVSPHRSAAFALNGNNAGPETSFLEEPAEQDVLETPREKKARRRSHLIIYLTTFNIAIGFSIVLTGVWPYMRQLQPGVSKDMLGWVIAANPIGQMIASPLVGLWGNWAGSNRCAMVTTMVLFCLGNLLYAVLSVFGSAALAVMITARFIVGVSSASMALIRTYTSSSTTLKERTPVVSLTSAAQAVGFIIGPAIQTALAVAFSEDTSEATNSTNVLDAQEGGESVGGGVGIQWNMYTATGWISCCFGLLNLVLFLPCIFQEYNIAAKEAQFQKRAANDQTSKIPKPDYVSLVVVLSTFFVTILIYVLLESLMVPMCMDLYAWTDQKAITVVGIGLSIGAGLCLFSFIAIKFLTKIVDERIVLIAGVLGMAVSMIIFIPMGSSYPKIKNCTSIYTLASHGNETLGIADAFHLTSLPDIDIGNAKVMSNNPATTEGNALFRESFDNSPVGDRDSSTTSKSDVPPQIDTNTRSLRRQRRHVPHTGDCKDTGCPPEQEWCSYTPIIELSQLGIASAIAVMGYPFVLTISSVLYSKVLGPKPQGLWMGLLISTGGLSRVIGPIFVSYIYTELGTRWIFGILLCVMTFTLLMNIIMYKRMVPMNIFGKR